MEELGKGWGEVRRNWGAGRNKGELGVKKSQGEVTGEDLGVRKKWEYMR